MFFLANIKDNMLISLSGCLISPNLSKTHAVALELDVLIASFILGSGIFLTFVLPHLSIALSSIPVVLGGFLLGAGIMCWGYMLAALCVGVKLGLSNKYLIGKKA